MEEKTKRLLTADLIAEIKEIKPTEREAKLLASLDESKFTLFDPDEKVEEQEVVNEQLEEVIEESPAEEAKEEPNSEEMKEESVAEEPSEHVEEKESEEMVEEPVEDQEEIKEEPISNESEEENKEFSEPTEKEQSEEEKEESVPFEDSKEESKPAIDEDLEDEENLTEEEKEERRKMKIRGSISQTVGESGNSKVPGKFEVFPEDDQFKYRLKANNGEILVCSYGYSTRDGAHAGIDTLKKNLESGVVMYITDKNGRSQWRLSTSNDSRIVALGETYSSMSSAQSAFASTQKFGKTEKIIDLDEIPASERREWEFEAEKYEEKDSGSIEIYDDNGKFRARLLANNQEVLFVTAQAYSSKASLKASLDNIKSKLNEKAFHLSKDKQGRYQFIMESGSGFVYIVGESYSTGAVAKSAAASVLSFINKATINDLTLKSSKVDVTLTGVSNKEEK